MSNTTKHSHYKKDVSGLAYVDIYRVLDLFEVVNPALQHAAKKILCAGGRGAKDWEKDVQEAIDSLQRALEMKKEDGTSAGIPDEIKTHGEPENGLADALACGRIQAFAGIGVK